MIEYKNLENIFNDETAGIVKTITKIAGELDEVLGITLYGSASRDEMGYLSDVDLIVLLKQVESSESAFNSILETLDYFTFIKKGYKYTIFGRSGLLKLDILFFDMTRPEEASLLIGGSEISLPSSILLSKDKKFDEMYNSARLRKNDAVSSTIKEADSFLGYYDSIELNLSRGDTYRAFFNYNLALFKLSTIVYSINKDQKFLFLPQWLLQKLEYTKRKALVGLSAKMNAVDLIQHRGELWELYERTITDSNVFPESYIKKIARFKEYLVNRYPQFWRLIDLSTLGKIKSKIVYRSARLDTQPVQALSDFLTSGNIKTIIDFRTEIELQKHGYSQEIKNIVRYVSIPIDLGEGLEKPAENNNEVDRMALYVNILNKKHFNNALQKFFGIISDIECFPIIYHCNAGVDRTGIITAMLLSILGFDRTSIIQNYYILPGILKKEYIVNFLDALESYGGTRGYLSIAGIDNNVIMKIKENLLIG